MRACALVLMITGAICRAQAPAPADVDPAGQERRILVMVRIPPAHFQPDASYGGGYQAQSGRASRHRIATELASAHRLVIDSDWPMNTLGVDCFLMRATDEVGRAVHQIRAGDAVETIER